MNAAAPAVRLARREQNSSCMPMHVLLLTGSDTGRRSAELERAVGYWKD